MKHESFIMICIKFPRPLPNHNIGAAQFSPPWLLMQPCRATTSPCDNQRRSGKIPENADRPQGSFFISLHGFPPKLLNETVIEPKNRIGAGPGPATVCIPVRCD